MKNKNNGKKISKFLKFFTLCLLPIYSSIQNNYKAQELNDFKAILHEETINKVFQAVGEIKGSNDYEIMLIKGKYHWTVVNPKIFLRPDSSFFECSANIEVGPFDYSAPVKGDVKIWYNEEKNEINVKIVRGIFEIYTLIMGKKVHIKNIDIADYLKDPFIFEGPKTLATDFEFMLPDSTKKHIYIQPSKCKMTVQWKEISTVCEIEASDKPFPKKTLQKKQNTSQNQNKNSANQKK